MNPAFLPMDEEGFFVLSSGTRWSDESSGRELLENLKVEDNGAITTHQGEQHYIVEPFDKPLVAQMVFSNQGTLSLRFPYAYEQNFDPKTLVLDPWDRFHGLTEKKIPFVMSRAAQAEFFQLLEDYDDESIQWNGKTYQVPNFYLPNSETETPQFWQTAYTPDGVSPWDLGGAHPAIEAILPQIKIIKSRIVNYGCGRGHDAALLAKKGHVVTGLDLSNTAIAEAQKSYGNMNNLNFRTEDVFKTQERAQYDMVFEHTLFCAISPERRKELIQRWLQVLDTGGHLLGIFFVMPHRGGPPYGSSEWELRSLLEKNFRLLYWKRWGQSPDHRQGTELVIYAQKRS